ncbi:hypothetical protein SAMN05518672_1011216 [Chitinophaga sp. CF118]|uniref:hypothetical protein n=1 Tax=Chitinophaga sp. CF118 TaxID=1884367 RepID=UPI0008E7344A|nr:hypothetical protein [Chitinophaga sp. CF118]SFD24200.1 hypothetical protein SAMN05518672_1011216 [Chitinophaga sp. CF118]
MPRQKSGYPHLSGRMGNDIYYYRKDRKNRKQYFIRQAPEMVTQTSATKTASADFGTASKSSRQIRSALKEYTRLCYDNRLHSRLNKKMAEILRADVNHPSGQRVFMANNLQSLQHFQFNGAANIQQLSKSTPVIEKNDSGDISISLPGTFSKSSHVLRNTTHITIKAIALSVNFAKGTTRQLESNTAVIKRGEKFTPVTLNVNRRDPTLIILEIQSFYEVNGQLHASQNKKGCALDVIAVLAPVEPPKEQKKRYRNKAPHFWMPYVAPARPALIIIPVHCNSLPAG